MVKAISLVKFSCDSGANINTIDYENKAASFLQAIRKILLAYRRYGRWRGKIEGWDLTLFPSITNLNQVNYAILKSGQDLSRFRNFGI